MIKYETIISNFDDKTTLYNWLRKVEEALKNASATNFVVNKKGNATLSFSITFADGTTLESGDIVLQQGESVDGARIASGVLQLHLTNGTWLTAGNLGAVSGFSINASQHLIVTYQDGTTQDLGAIFNGNVNIAGNFTADSIIENMTGYSASLTAKENLTNTPIYVSAVKNGNKLTVVYFGQLVRTGDISGFSLLINISIPSAVGAKLYPSVIAGNTFLDYRKVLAINVDDGTFVDLSLGWYKSSNTQINILAKANSLTPLTANQTYLLRYEATFLLSDSLI